ncbi:putative DNA-binding transcriptional regulator AlpA [Aurantimicrobium minutum]|uniref:hypothetical protein n=1 Tax=Aurantimicrobium minutum TaxID=708131 RepID=UPI0024756761|nr:hypothetical protein [Aurantimicrobium minutum]MDH6532088.1 putative DNA-binding transcriptional regulator AlpA [Aurantimicrobium minutum]
MTTYVFDVEVEEIDREDETWIDFFATQKFEAVFSWRDFQTYLDFVVEAPSPREAVELALDSIAQTDLQVVRIVLDLVGVQDIAVDYGVSRETARLWTHGHRRNGFPRRYTQVGNKSAWARSDVFAWAEKNNLARQYAEKPLPLDVVEIANGELAQARTAKEVRLADISA